MKIIFTSKLTKLFIFLIFIGLYLFMRFYNITVLPIFNDEAWIIYWSRLIAQTNTHWLISLIDGKPPLFFWVMALFFKMLPSLPYLFVGRLPSIFFGTVSLFAIYKLSYLLFNSKKVAIIACLFYIISPFILMYDRLVLYDSLLNAMLVWTVYFTVKTSQSLQFSDTIFWGVFLGLSLYTKPTASIFMFLTPWLFITSVLNKKANAHWKRKTLLVIFPIIIAELMHATLIFSHGYHDYVTVNQRYTPSIVFLITHPFHLFFQNFSLIISWIIQYQTLPVFLIGCFAFIVLLKKHLRQGLLLFILFFIPLLVFAFVAKVLFPRYILFTIPYFLIALAYYQSLLFNKKFQIVGYFVFTIIVIPMIIFDINLLTNPSLAPLPTIESYQFITGPPSGYGLPETFHYLHTQNSKKSITIVTLGTISSYPYAYNLDFWNDKNVDIIALWPVTKDTDKEIQSLAKHHTVYVVLKLLNYTGHSDFLTELHLKKVFTATKPGGMYPITIAQPINTL